MPSTTQHRLRLALMLLLPLYMRSACSTELFLIPSLAGTIAFLLTTFVARKPFNRALAIRLALSLTATYLASTCANMLFKGPWIQLLMTYMMPLRLVRDLLFRARLQRFDAGDKTEFQRRRRMAAMILIITSVCLALADCLKASGGLGSVVLGWLCAHVTLCIFYIDCMRFDLGVRVKLAGSSEDDAKKEKEKEKEEKVIEGVKKTLEDVVRNQHRGCFWKDVEGLVVDWDKIGLMDIVKEQKRPSTRRRG